jgi:hypothetical protein
MMLAWESNNALYLGEQTVASWASVNEAYFEMLSRKFRRRLRAFVGAHSFLKAGERYHRDGDFIQRTRCREMRTVRECEL